MWHFHEGIKDVVNGNLDHLNDIDGTNGFFTMIRKMYAHSACLGIRRQVKSNRDSFSLMTVLDFMKTNHATQGFLSKEKFLKWRSHKGWDIEYSEVAYEMLLGEHQDMSESIAADIDAEVRMSPN